MMPYTLPIKEAETKTLIELVQYAQTNRRPLILTQENPAETLAILLSPSRFEDLERKERRLYHWQLIHLLREIEKMEQHWEDGSTQELFVKNFPESTYELWKLCPEPMKRACLSLDLAAQRLRTETLTHDKMTALRYLIELIRQGESDKDIIWSAKQKLISAGLPPRLGGSRELVELYMEEL
ncbi:MAG: hypothetical protein AAF639_14815 [Chloroflexota bacterium]